MINNQSKEKWNSFQGAPRPLPFLGESPGYEVVDEYFPSFYHKSEMQTHFLRGVEWVLGLLRFAVAIFKAEDGWVGHKGEKTEVQDGAYSRGYMS